MSASEIWKLTKDIAFAALLQTCLFYSLASGSALYVLGTTALVAGVHTLGFLGTHNPHYPLFPSLMLGVFKAASDLGMTWLWLTAGPAIPGRYFTQLGLQRLGALLDSSLPVSMQLAAQDVVVREPIAGLIDYFSSKHIKESSELRKFSHILHYAISPSQAYKSGVDLLR